MLMTSAEKMYHKMKKSAQDKKVLFSMFYYHSMNTDTLLFKLFHHYMSLVCHYFNYISS